jgi:hypothetical protein
VEQLRRAGAPMYRGDLLKGLTFPCQPISGKSILSGSMPFYKRIYTPGELLPNTGASRRG